MHKFAKNAKENGEKRSLFFVETIRTLIFPANIYFRPAKMLDAHQRRPRIELSYRTVPGSQSKSPPRLHSLHSGSFNSRTKRHRQRRALHACHLSEVIGAAQARAHITKSPFLSLELFHFYVAGGPRRAESGSPIGCRRDITYLERSVSSRSDGHTLRLVASFRPRKSISCADYVLLLIPAIDMCVCVCWLLVHRKL